MNDRPNKSFEGDKFKLISHKSKLNKLDRLSFKSKLNKLDRLSIKSKLNKLDKLNINAGRYFVSVETIYLSFLCTIKQVFDFLCEVRLRIIFN